MVTKCLHIEKRNVFSKKCVFANSNKPLTDKYFNQAYDFNDDAKFTLTKSLNLKNARSDVKIPTLKDREDFRIKKLYTVIPYGFNQEPNFQAIKKATNITNSVVSFRCA